MVRTSALQGLLLSSLVLGSPLLALAQVVAETFEGPPAAWITTRTATGTGVVAQSTTLASAGEASAGVATSGASSTAYVGGIFSDAYTSHALNERPGTFRWQRARLYIPSATVAQLGATGSVTVAGFWPSAAPTRGWYLRVKAGGQVFLQGARDWDGAAFEFPAYAIVPLDRWFTLEVGLHSQAGPGVKRAFAFFIDGVVHGWYRQGHFNNTFDRVGMGIVNTTASGPLQVNIDEWGVPGTAALPTGPDLRSTIDPQTIDFRAGGDDWQIDWTTWANNLRLHPTFGLYSDTDRLQSGRNLDRGPSLTSGWAEIEVDWPKGTPPMRPDTWFGPMVGFRKEINREQNLEVVPIGRGGGAVDLLLEAWDGNGGVPFASWPLPIASVGGTSIPEPGDIIRVRWEQVTPTDLSVLVHYFDASAAQWHTGIIAGTYNISAINGVNFVDGFHQMASVTVDSPFYAIRRFHVGTLATYPPAGGCAFELTPATVSLPPTASTITVALATASTCTWTASSSSSWLSVDVASGTGPATLTLAAAAHTAAAPRTAALTVGGVTVSVTQEDATDTAPPVISALTAEPTGPTTATVNWTTDEASSSQVDYGIGGPAQSTPLDARLTTSHTVVLTGLVPGATYVAVARSVDAASNAATSTAASFSMPALPSLSVDDTAAPEGSGAGGTLVFTVRLSGASTQPVAVAYATAGGTAVAPADFAAISGTLSFPPGTTSLPVSVILVGDADVEPDETLTLVLSSADNATIGDGSGLGTITNDDAVGAGLVVNDASAAEGETGATPLTFTVTLSSPSPQPVTVAYSTADGTATAGSDYSATSGMLTFAPGETTHLVTVAVLGDSLAEASETFTLVLSSPANATIVDGNGVATIVNDDPMPSLTMNGGAAVEGNAGSATASFTVSLSAASGLPVSVGYSTIAATAAAGVDFTPASGSLTLPPGSTSGTISVSLLGDTLHEADETFTVAISTPVNATIAAAAGIATIIDDDPVPAMTLGSATAVEGNTGTMTAAFPVTLSAASGLPVSAAYTTVAGTASAAVDYATSAGVLSIPAGATSGLVFVPIIADVLDEADETFTVALSAPVNASIAVGTATGIIADDDPTPTLAISDATVVEGNSGATSAIFTVTLSAPSGLGVTVNAATVNGSATAGSDFSATSAAIAFAPGINTQSFAVPVLGDTLAEPNETFTVVLGGAVNAGVADGTGVGTVTNDDVAAGPITVTATFPVIAGADDVNEDGASFTPGGSTMWLGTAAAASTSYAGLRFANVSIPAGATITSARVEVRASATQRQSIAFQFGVEAVANSTAFSTSSRPSQRTLATPKVAHSSNQQWIGGTWYALDQVAALLQTAVNYPGWTAGNAFSLVLRGTGRAWGRKFVSTFEAGAANAPRLVVTYTVP